MTKEPRKKAAPAFQMYASDWLGSTAVTLMTLAEQGAYLRLLCHQWGADDCSLPCDAKKLANLSGLGKVWNRGSGVTILGNFDTEDGRIYNAKLRDQWLEQKLYREKQSEAGKKGAEIRWQHH